MNSYRTINYIGEKTINVRIIEASKNPVFYRFCRK